MMSSRKSVERCIAEYVCDLHIQDVSQETVNAFDRLLLDYIAVVIAGFGNLECRRASHVFAAYGGRAESSVIGTSVKVTAPAAAFAHGVCAHWFDWDDTHDESHVHCGAVIFSALIALCEARAASGYHCMAEEFVCAVVGAYDIACRVGGFLKEHSHRGWMPTGSGTTIAAAAAGARLMRMKTADVWSAMGIAAANAGLSRQALADRINGKGILAGLSAKTAVEAVLLAQGGIVGAPCFLTGVYGLQALHAGGRGHAAAICKDLGERFSITEVSIKPYPSCRSTHAVIDVILAMKKGRPGFTETVNSLRVIVPAGIYERCGAPFQLGNDPRLSAQFSIPFTAAAALKKDNLAVSDFMPAAVRRTYEELRGLIDDISVSSTDCVQSDVMSPVVVQFMGPNGTVERVGETVQGSPNAPLSSEEQFKKLQIAAQGMVPEKKIRVIHDMIRNVRVEGPLSLVKALQTIEDGHVQFSST